MSALNSAGDDMKHVMRLSCLVLVKKKKKNRGGATKSEDPVASGSSDSSKIRHLLSVHPLSVVVDIRLKSGSVVLTFKVGDGYWLTVGAMVLDL